MQRAVAYVRDCSNVLTLFRLGGSKVPVAPKMPSKLRKSKKLEKKTYKYFMLQNPLAVLKKPSFLLQCLLIVELWSENPQKAQSE